MGHIMLTSFSSFFFLSGLLPRKLRRNLPADAASQADVIEGDITAAMAFPWGSPTREAINHSFNDTFRTMLLVGLILVACAFVCSLLIEDRNIREVDASREYKGVVIGKSGTTDALKGKVTVVRQEEKTPAAEETSV